MHPKHRVDGCFVIARKSGGGGSPPTPPLGARGIRSTIQIHMNLAFIPSKGQDQHPRTGGPPSASQPNPGGRGLRRGGPCQHPFVSPLFPHIGEENELEDEVVSQDCSTKVNAVRTELFSARGQAPSRVSTQTQTHGFGSHIFLVYLVLLLFVYILTDLASFVAQLYDSHFSN